MNEIQQRRRNKRPRDAELPLTDLAEYNLANEVVWWATAKTRPSIISSSAGKYKNRPNGNTPSSCSTYRCPSRRPGGVSEIKKRGQDDRIENRPGGQAPHRRARRRIWCGVTHRGVNAYVVKPVDFQAFLEAAATRRLGPVQMNPRLAASPPQALKPSPPGRAYHVMKLRESAPFWGQRSDAE